MNTGLYDIHMHLIPGVDDGSLDMLMTREMMRRSCIQGTQAIFATPHSLAFLMDRDGVLRKFDEVKHLAFSEFPGLELYLGCEVMCEAGTMEKTVSRLKTGLFPTMNGTRYVLSELQPWVKPEEALSCASSLMEADFIPIIAHVERYPNLIQQPETLEMLRQMGCLFQINVCSICEEDNVQICQAACHLLDIGMVDFLGSDAHKTYYRPPRVVAGLEYLHKNYEKNYVDSILQGNAQKLLISTET